MKTKRQHRAAPLLGLWAVAMVLAALFATASAAPKRGGKGAKPTWQQGADARKADYIYMEALAQNALGNDDAYFELLQRAYELDSTDTSVGQTLGAYLMMLSEKDTVMASRGFDMMRRHFDLHPDDYYGGIFYGMINNRLDNLAEAARVWTVMDSLFPTKTDITMNLAEALQNLRDSLSLRRSIGVLSRLERSQGRDLSLSARKARALLALGDTTAAVSEVMSLLASSPRSANYSVYAGDLFQALERPDSALKYYNRACAIDSASGLAYYKRAEFYRSVGDSAAFDREVFHALHQESLDVDVKMEMLGNYVRNLYTDSLQQPRIRELFAALLDQHPHEPQIRDLYSSYLVAVGQFGEAAEQQRMALDQDPSQLERWTAVMSLYATEKDNAAAVATGRDALRYFPDEPQLNLLIGANLQQMEQTDSALAFFRRAEALTDSADTQTRSQIVASIGDVFYATERPDSAFAYYDRALELDPENLLAMNNCAYYLAEQNRDLDRAESLSAICVRANPENDTALDTYAWIFFKKKDYAKAREYIDRAIALETDDPQADVLHHAGDIYYFLGLPDEALDFWTQALKLEPDNALLKKKVAHRTHFFK